MFTEDFVTKNCVLKYSNISPEEFYPKFIKRPTEENCNDCHRELGLQKRGCYCCEHYEYCPKMCWNKILFQHYELNECPIKRIYQYIENNSQILSMYDSWRSLYELSWKTNGI